RYTVVLGHAAVADLLETMVWNLDAREADEGRSFFSRPGGATRVGEVLFPELISLRSNPADAAMPSAPFDFDGLPLKPISWIEKGRLTALRCSRYWAQKTGKQPTGYPSSYALAGGSAAAL